MDSTNNTRVKVPYCLETPTDMKPDAVNEAVYPNHQGIPKADAHRRGQNL
jgi:hypothetical protein